MIMKKISLFFIVLIIIALALTACSSDEGSDVDTPPTATPVINVPEQPESDEAELESEEPPEVDVNSSRGLFDSDTMIENLQNYVLRSEDLPNEYRIIGGGELHHNNQRVINTVGEVEGKRYMAATGRLDGWSLELERVKRDELIPYTFYSQVEVFETTEGAQTAFSPDWLPVYQETEDEDKIPNWIEEGCDYGDGCLLYFFEKLDPATELTTLQYEMVFVYRNVVGKIMARGVDYDMAPDYFSDAAEIFFSKVDAAPLAD
jgi:hypothetical protein